MLSAQAVVHLSSSYPILQVREKEKGSTSKDINEAADLPAPPLQRPMKVHLKPADPISVSDCLQVHCFQIEERQAERVAAVQAARRQHIDDMRELKGRVANTFEEVAARRSWNKQVAREQLVQTEEKMQAELEAYKDSHAPTEYWPYEAASDRRGFAVPPKKVYGAELLLAAQQKANAMALQKIAQRRGGTTTMPLRHERQLEQATIDASTVREVPPHQVKSAQAVADQRRREAVAALAAQAYDGKLAAAERWEEAPNLSRFQLKEAQREIREKANKEQLREILSKQMAERQLRELKEHAHTYGEGPNYQSTLDRMVEKAMGAQHLSRDQQIRNGQKRRAELERAIQEKQRERRELRKLAQQKQKEIDDTAAATETLMHERDRMRKAETQTKMQIDMLTAHEQKKHGAK